MSGMHIFPLAALAIAVGVFALTYVFIGQDTSAAQESSIDRILYGVFASVRSFLGASPTGYGWMNCLMLGIVAGVIIIALGTLAFIIGTTAEFVDVWGKLRRIKRLSMDFPASEAITGVASYLVSAPVYVWVVCAAADALRFAGPGAVQPLAAFVSMENKRWYGYMDFKGISRAAIVLAHIGDDQGAQALAKAIEKLDQIKRVRKPREKHKVEAFSATLRQAQKMIQNASSNKRPSQLDS